MPQAYFRRLAAQTEQELNLAEAALVLASSEYQQLDIERYLGLLDQYASEVTATLPKSDAPAAVLDHIRQYLFDAHGFAGNENSFYDPRNSFLNDVLDRKLGIPITLSVVYLEVAWRLGVPLRGVSLPGRFMVGLFDADEPIILDPFDGGKKLGAVEVQDKLEQMFGALTVSSKQLHDMLVPSTKKEILVRMLRNLKSIYLANQNFDAALGAIERMLMLQPDEPVEVRDRGLVFYYLNRHEFARADWQRYLQLAPESADKAEVEKWLDRLKSDLGSSN